MSTELQNMIYKNRTNLLSMCGPFLQCFGTKINPFWIDNMIGFDIVAFDAWLKVCDGKSTKEFIFDQYGQKGVDIIETLLGSNQQAACQ